MNRIKVIKSLFYKFIERFAVKGIGLILSILLARMLAPSAFGEIAILLVFVDLSLTLIDGGLNTALVQSKEVSESDYSTVFYITLALSCVMILLLQLFAPLIARFYESPEIVAPLRFYAFSLLFSSFNSIQVARMQREMRFKEMMFCNLAATVLSGTLGVILAYKGAGLWALVIYYFAQVFITSFALLFVLRWFPQSPFSKDSAKRLYSFGIKMLAASLITTLYNDIRPLIIGKKFSTADLGYYDRGQRFSSTISLNLDVAVQSVMFPVLSQVQDDKAQFASMLRRTKQLGAFVIFPAMLGMAAVAEPMVRLLLTAKWLPCVSFVVILCIAEAQVPLTSSNLVAVKALGRSDIYAKQEIIRRVLMLIVLAVSVLAFDSVVAIAVGFLISAWLDAFVTSLSVKDLLGYSFFDQMKDVWKSALTSVLMAGAVYALGLLHLPLLPGLILQVAGGCLVYITFNLAIKNESLLYILNLLKGRKAA